MNGRHKAVPASYVILRKEDKILLMLRKNTGYYDGWYTIPSGHIEAGELPAVAAAREAMEEVGLELDTASMRFVHVMYRTACDETGDRADYFFEATTWQDEPVNAEPEKCERLEWVSLNALPSNVIHHVVAALACIGQGVAYSERGADLVIKNPSSHDVASELASNHQS